jgi:PPOX class probable F420-dependent enzyme
MDLDHFTALGRAEQGLCIVSTLRPDGSIQSSLVNAGVLAHPSTGEPVVGFVASGSARKLFHLRARPTATIATRSGWDWAAVDGQAQIIGPDDAAPGITADRLRVLLREVFVAAGGSHDDWDTYDRTMTDERRAAVLVTPTRAYTNRR